MLFQWLTFFSCSICHCDNVTLSPCCRFCCSHLSHDGHGHGGRLHLRERGRARSAPPGRDEGRPSVAEDPRVRLRGPSPVLPQSLQAGVHASEGSGGHQQLPGQVRGSTQRRAERARTQDEQQERLARTLRRARVDDNSPQEPADARGDSRPSEGDHRQDAQDHKARPHQARVAHAR